MIIMIIYFWLVFGWLAGWGVAKFVIDGAMDDFKCLFLPSILDDWLSSGRNISVIVGNLWRFTQLAQRDREKEIIQVE